MFLDEQQSTNGGRIGLRKCFSVPLSFQGQIEWEKGGELTYASFDVDLPLGKEVLQVFHSQLHKVSPQRGAFV